MLHDQIRIDAKSFENHEKNTALDFTLPAVSVNKKRFESTHTK